MNIPLYARMNEFAPVSSGIGGADASPEASHVISQEAPQEASHEEQEEASHDESGKFGSLFEQCIPHIGKFAGKASQGDDVVTTDSARQDMAQSARLTADVPDLKIDSSLAEGSLTDGYKLHDVAFFDSESLNTITKPTNISDVELKDFARSSPVQTNVVPNLEFDYSADVAA